MQVIVTSICYCIISYGVTALLRIYIKNENNEYIYIIFNGLPSALNKTRNFIRENLSNNFKQIEYKLIDRNIMAAKAQVDCLNNKQLLGQLIESTELNADIDAYIKIPHQTIEKFETIPKTIQIWIAITCIYTIYKLIIEDTIIYNKLPATTIIQAFIVAILKSITCLVLIKKALNYNSNYITINTAILYCKTIILVFTIHLIIKIILNIIK